MSDLFGNHIVGSPTRRLICVFCITHTAGSTTTTVTDSFVTIGDGGGGGMVCKITNNPSH